MISSSSFPAGPTKGMPTTSSLLPGASPTISTSQGIWPRANTTCCRVLCKSHF
jgi:hypothetical protein